VQQIEKPSKAVKGLFAETKYWLDGESWVTAGNATYYPDSNQIEYYTIDPLTSRKYRNICSGSEALEENSDGTMGDSDPSIVCRVTKDSGNLPTRLEVILLDDNWKSSSVTFKF
jgi:hypothetical protein